MFNSLDVLAAFCTSWKLLILTVKPFEMNSHLASAVADVIMGKDKGKAVATPSRSGSGLKAGPKKSFVNKQWFCCSCCMFGKFCQALEFAPDIQG